MRRTLLLIPVCLAAMFGSQACNSVDALSLHGDSLAKQQEKFASQAKEAEKALDKSTELASKIDDSAVRIRSGDKSPDVKALARDFSATIQKMEGEREELAAQNEAFEKSTQGTLENWKAVLTRITDESRRRQEEIAMLSRKRQLEQAVQDGRNAVSAFDEAIKYARDTAAIAESASLEKDVVEAIGQNEQNTANIRTAVSNYKLRADDALAALRTVRTTLSS